ncbi:MAG: glycoside hydrolase family 3 N-terminal domain-containing protein, partial [Bacteroidota bacterium]
MKKLLFGGLKVLVATVLLLVIGFFGYWKWNIYQNHSLLGERALILTHNGQSYRDLNKNGQLDVYEDRTAALEDRVEDLLGQMTVAEKAGMMFITMALMNNDGTPLDMPVLSEPFSFFLETNSTLLAKKRMNHFNILQSPSAEALATWNNEIQIMAERTRLGIPVTVASDPRHSVTDVKGPSVYTPFYSRWTSPLGFAAIGDTLLMREFGEIANTEYRKTGIRLALSPMADLSTEPRWGRTIGTFGEDAALSARLTKAYIQGFQGDSLNDQSVACMVKHFSGGGPQKDGEDPHFHYGKDQVYPAGQFDYHLIPFEQGAFPAKAAQVMPYYGVPVGQTTEEVGFGYNKDIITGLLREKYQFDGVVCTDWGLVSENDIKPPAAFGVEDLTERERMLKILEAGCDMYGGESRPEDLVALVAEGQLSEERLDESVRRILRDKFRLGLFENPFVKMGDLWMVGHYDIQQRGLASQRRSLTLLKNDNKLLPLPQKELKVYVKDLPTDPFWTYATVVDDPAAA